MGPRGGIPEDEEVREKRRPLTSPPLTSLSDGDDGSSRGVSVI